jgi:hypothetical protein
MMSDVVPADGYAAQRVFAMSMSTFRPWRSKARHERCRDQLRQGLLGSPAAPATACSTQCARVQDVIAADGTVCAEHCFAHSDSSRASHSASVQPAVAWLSPAVTIPPRALRSLHIVS